MPDLTSPPRTRAVRARLATLAVFLANGLGIGAWAACIPAIKLQLGLADAALGVALLAFAAGAIVAMPTAGWLGARLGNHRLAVAAASVFASLLPWPGEAGQLAGLMAAAFLVGMANGMLDVSMNAHATTVERAWGTPIMSSFHAAFSLGGLTGAAGVGVLLGQGLAPASCLGVMAAMIFTLVVVACVAGLKPVGTVAGEALRSDPEHAGFAWPSRAQLGIGMLTFLTMLTEGAIADWSGVFLVSVAGAAVAVAAGGYAAFSVAMVTCRLLGDRIVLALGDVRVLRLGALLAAVGMTLALVWPSPVSAAIGFGLVGLGVANGVPVLFSAAGRTRPAAPSVGVAMAATIGYAGFLAGPPVIGFVAELVGLRLALTLLLAAAALTALAARPILAPARRRQLAASRPAT